MKMVFEKKALILLMIISGLCSWAVSGDVDSRIPAKNALSEKAPEADGTSPLIEKRSDLDDVDFSSFFDMDIGEEEATADHKGDSIADRNAENQDSSSSSVVDSESNQTDKKNSTPSSQNKVVVGPYQVSVVDSRSPLLSSLGFKRKHLQHLTSSAYSPYSHRRSSYYSRYHSPHSFQTSESVRSSSYAEYPSQHPPNYGPPRPPPPNSYPEDRNKEYVPMGGHYRGNDREVPQDHSMPYAQDKAYRPNSVDNIQPYGPYKPNYGPPQNPAPHNSPSDAYRGGSYPNPSADPTHETPKRGPYGYAEPIQQPYGTDGQDLKENSENRVPWRQTGQFPLHPSPLTHRAPPHSSPTSYSQNKPPYSPPSSSSRLQEKPPYSSSSSSYSRPAEVSHSYSKSQYGSSHDQRSYQSYAASRPHQHHSSYHPSSGSPKAKMPQRAGAVSYGSEGSYHSHHHSAAPSKPVITVKFKTKSPEGGHGLSIPLNFNPIEVVKKLATPLAALNPLANKKVTIGITIENKNKHELPSDILHSY